ncbi:MAG: molybdenum cofactor biosynthesis protein MoaE, partial [Xanthomonadales bacterium]|nr:molybdenum cofactor biosynthesis protein MoaE [Xanthomonadales bacterium]
MGRSAAGPGHGPAVSTGGRRMKKIAISREPIRTADLADELTDRSCGAYVSFEGWVRDHNEGRVVRSLEYEVYRPLAV